DMPSHEQLIAARDHVVERHADLSVIGAHYGSLEYDMAEVADHFERYPNFAIDTSGRLGDAAYHDRETMRDFFTRYQDRILWGTDQGVNRNPDATPEQRRAAMAEMEKMYELEWAFFATDQPVTVHGRPSQGLALPEPVLARMFHDNACAWYPRLQEAPAV
ncbi:MAG: amidohydrolase family protein, partial [Phycisphaeraceae bacterium]